MVRYRYRTAVLTGRWRDTQEAAERDAVKAKQALLNAGDKGGLHWLVPGEIEADESGSALKERVRRH